MWELNCFSALNLFKLGQAPGTWTKNAYISLPLPSFSPKALVCGDRTWCWHDGQWLSIGSTCMWHGAFEPQTTPSPGLPSTTCHSSVGSRVCSSHKSLGGSVPSHPSPPRVRKLYFEIQNVVSWMASQGYPYANQRTSFLSVPLLSPPLCPL